MIHLQHVNLNPSESQTVAHQQTPEPEAALLVCDGVLAEEATFSLTHGLHGHVPLCVTAQGLHRSVAAERNREKTKQKQNEFQECRVLNRFTQKAEGRSDLYAVFMPVMLMLRLWPSSTVIIWDAGSKRNSFIIGLK